MLLIMLSIGLALMLAVGLTNWHMFAYGKTQVASAVNVQLPGIQDQVLTRVSDNNFVMPQACNLVGVWGFGATLGNLRLNTPKYRSISLPSLVPVNQSLTPPSPINGWFDKDFPLSLNAVDEIEIDSTNTAAATDDEYAIAIVMFNPQPLPVSPIYRVRATAAIVSAAFTWTTGQLIFDQVLPAGIYNLVGMQMNGLNCLAGRLIFPNAPFRPGCIAQATPGGQPFWAFAEHGLGTWASFESINAPNLEVLGSGVTTTQEVFLDLQYASNTQMLGVSIIPTAGY